MRPTEVFRREHRVIAQVLNCLEKLADRAAMQGWPDVHDFRQVLEFLGGFLALHCAKEEACLFELIAQVQTTNQPTAIIHGEHEDADTLLRSMVDLLGRCAGNRECLRQLIGKAHEYVRLQRHHIQTEDALLLPAVEQNLTDERALAEKMSAWQTRKITPVDYERFLKMATELADRLQVTRVYQEFAEESLPA
jgi:hemerythrin-like domain-containing protein